VALRQKVPELAVHIKSLSQQGLDAALTVQDPSGEMEGTVHADVLAKYKGQIVSGTVLLLREVPLYIPTGHEVFLIITLANIVSVYPPWAVCPHTAPVMHSWREQYLSTEQMTQLHQERLKRGIASSPKKAAAKVSTVSSPSPPAATVAKGTSPPPLPSSSPPSKAIAKHSSPPPLPSSAPPSKASAKPLPTPLPPSYSPPLKATAKASSPTVPSPVAKGNATSMPLRNAAAKAAPLSPPPPSLSMPSTPKPKPPLPPPAVAAALPAPVLSLAPDLASDDAIDAFLASAADDQLQ